jgi:hypothetical protein
MYSKKTFERMILYWASLAAHAHFVLETKLNLFCSTYLVLALVAPHLHSPYMVTHVDFTDAYILSMHHFIFASMDLQKCYSVLRGFSVCS